MHQRRSNAVRDGWPRCGLGAHRSAARTYQLRACERVRHHLGELRPQRLGQCSAVSLVETLEHQSIDGELNPAHTHPRISASESGRSIFCASSLAASTRYFMPTGVPACAARNAAFSAMLRMFPPATFSCESFFRSRSWVGVVAGKTRLQMAARWAASGNGKLTVKRSRRWKARSRADFMFVVRIASP